MKINQLPQNYNDPLLISIGIKKLFLKPLNNSLHSAIKSKTTLFDIGEIEADSLEPFLNSFTAKYNFNPLILVDADAKSSSYILDKFKKEFDKNGAIVKIDSLTESTIQNLLDKSITDIYISIDSTIIGESYIDPFNTTKKDELAPHLLCNTINLLLNNFKLRGAEYLNIEKALEPHLFSIGNLQSFITIHSTIINSFKNN